jgi:hypothetical protein
METTSWLKVVLGFLIPAPFLTVDTVELSDTVQKAGDGWWYRSLPARSLFIDRPRCRCRTSW